MGATPGYCLEVRFRGNVNNQQVMNVLHYQVMTGSTLSLGGPEELAIINAIKAGGPDDIITSYLACISPDYLLTDIDAQFVWSTRFVNVTESFASNGTFVGACDAQNLSTNIIKRTTLAGRGYVGAMHIPALPKTAYVAGELTGAYLTALGNLLIPLKSNITPAVGAGVYAPAIFHRPMPALLGPCPPARPARLGSLTNISAWLTTTTVRCQRRRTIGIGI